jgi:hypothetical protein
MFDAQQARQQTNAVAEAERKRKLLGQYFSAIELAAKGGKTSCAFYNVPDDVIWELRNLGYKVEVDLDRNWRIVSW